MTDEISKFDGKHAFLSNFYPVKITYMEMTGPTLEHVYQACKAKRPESRDAILRCETAGDAKRKARKIVRRDDWNDDVKMRVMLDLLRLKFESPGLRQQLLATGDAWLVEGNTWGDEFWGVCRGRGKNILGLMLMEVRHALRNAK